MITHIKGDLLALADSGMFEVICHGYNCQNKMGAGIARQIAQRWPLALEVDRRARDRNSQDPSRMLGSYSLAKVSNKDHRDLVICNLYTQYRYGRGCQIDYAAIRSCFKQLSNIFPFDYRLGMPKIGAGLGGGDWDKILEILTEVTPESTDITVVEYG